MMKEFTHVHEARKANLDKLVLKMGTLDAVAKAVGSSPVYLSQIRHGTPDSVHGTPRRMGSSLARRIEAACRLPDGWLDVMHTDESEMPKQSHAFAARVSADHGLNDIVKQIDMDLVGTLVDIAAMIRAQEEPERTVCKKLLYNMCEEDGDGTALLLAMMLKDPKTIV